MKRISKLLIAVLLALNTGGVAYADSCATALMPFFTAAQSKKLCDAYGTSTFVHNNATYEKWKIASGAASLSLIGLDANNDTILQSYSAGDLVTFILENDSNRKISFSGTSDTQLDALFGDASTGGQRFEFRAQTANAADTNVMCLTGGGDCEDHARGSFLYLAGADAGGANAGDVYLGSTDDMFFQSGTGGNIAFTISDAGVKTFGLAADANFNVGLATIGFQEAVAGTACSGTVTFNGTTAVTKATTCATTGSRIFLTPTSDPTGATAAYCWVTNIVNGTSFDVDCDQANDGTANWVIFHESP